MSFLTTLLPSTRFARSGRGKLRHYTYTSLAVFIAGCSGAALAAPFAVAAPSASAAPSYVQARTITVSVASSLTDVLTDLAKRYERIHGVRVRVNAAASNTLARQIVEGAPVDLFVSADEAQMAMAARAGRLVGSPIGLLSNQLVVVTGRNAKARLQHPKDLASAAIRRVAMGQPDSVPAGVYARQWLEKQGLWTAVQPKVVPMPTVRAALATVREGHADAAIVYATDARTSPDVRVAFTVPMPDAPPIVYPAALVAGERQGEASRFLIFLQSPEARAVFEAAGFLVLAGR